MKNKIVSKTLAAVLSAATLTGSGNGRGGRS